jgi:tetratricopeptide (TPR) repeat protein
VSGHRLTMRVVRERAPRDGSMARLGAGAVKLLDEITRSLPEPLENRSAAGDTVRQVLDLHRHLVPFLGQHDTALTADLLRLRGWAIECLNRLGDSFSQVIEQGPPLVDDCERVLGHDHPETLRARGNLAIAYQAAGHLAEAIPLYERCRADCERVLGPDDPETLTARNNVAAAYEDAGRRSEAIPLYERTLADRTRVLGQDHPDTLGSRNNLAHAYREAGRLAEAISMFERSLTDYERVLGRDHPYTLGSRNNLARAYQEAGRLAEAISMFEQSLAGFERVLGPDHPFSLQLQHNLAGAYWAAGRLPEAIPLYKRALAGREQALGETHPDTLKSRCDLDLAYQAAGRTNPLRSWWLIRVLCGEAESEACQVAGPLPAQRRAGPVHFQPEQVERAGHVEVVEASLGQAAVSGRALAGGLVHGAFDACPAGIIGLERDRLLRCAGGGLGFG